MVNTTVLLVDTRDGSIRPVVILELEETYIVLSRMGHIVNGMVENIIYSQTSRPEYICKDLEEAYKKGHRWAIIPLEGLGKLDTE